MRPIPSLTVALVLLVSLLGVSGCAERPVAVQNYPSPVDLQVQPKPVLDPSALDSDKALNDYDAAIEAWGEAGWLTVGRVCTWAKAMGMREAPC